MDERKENDLLEETLSIAETDYAQAYRFLLAVLLNGRDAGCGARLAPNGH